MRSTFINCLTNLAREDQRIFLITPDLGFSVLEGFAQEFPERFLNVGVAEQNAIGIAAGLALSGKVVYVYSIIPFITMRPFEQIRVNVAYMNTKVRIVGVGAGFSYGPQGSTHHAIEDIAIMRALPNMTVCCPGDPIEVREIINQSANYEGPMYIRLGKNGEPQIHDDNEKMEIGKAVQVTEGKDFVIITTSNMLEEGMKVIEDFKRDGKTGILVSMHTIKPLDVDAVLQLITLNIPIVTLEEHNIIGGLGSAVAEVIAESGCKAKFKRIGIGDQYCHCVNTQQNLRKIMVNLDDIKEDLFE